MGLLTYYISVGILLAYIPICLYTGEQVGFFLLLAFAHVGLLAFGTQIHDLRTFGAGTDIYIDIYM